MTPAKPQGLLRRPALAAADHGAEAQEAAFLKSIFAELTATLGPATAGDDGEPAGGSGAASRRAR